LIDQINRDVRFETGLLAPEIVGFWTTLSLMGSSWSRQTAISNFWRTKVLAPRLSFFVSAIIDAQLQLAFGDPEEHIAGAAGRLLGSASPLLCNSKALRC
jgi:hypothetical protein